MVERLFVYGSLQPGHSNEHVLHGIQGSWARGTVRGRLTELGWGAAMGYKALILDEAAAPVPGHVLTSKDLTDRWVDLDAFEGEEYDRVLTSVHLEDGTSTDAYVYVSAEAE